jgi:hypothetical protein
MPKSTLLIAIASVFTSVSAIAATTFSDSAMNVDDYSLTTFAPSQTVSAFTTLAGGNPGSALQVDFQGTGKSFLYFLNKTFVYNPATSGAITGIDWSSDGYITNSTGVGSHFQTLLLKQGDNLYSFSKAISTAQATWDTASAIGLKSTDFSLITNLATSSQDSSSHPSFTTGGPIQFGFAGGLFVNSASRAVERSDNLFVTIHAVPEPATTALWMFGLAALGLRAVHKRRHSAGQIQAAA